VRTNVAVTVHPLLPLSFLEAVRDVDAPDGDPDAEYVQELRSKRLGLSDTILAQIRRYSEAVKRNQRQAFDEVVALATLLGRRPDAEAVFRSAGRHTARTAYLDLSATARRVLMLVPQFVARPLALRHTKRIARRYFGGRVWRVGSFVFLEVSRSVTLPAAPRSAGCAYYESGLREVLRLLVGGAGAVEHVRCGARGDAICEWRAEWR
jgi:predicted hydrocarbon binding protein